MNITLSQGELVNLSLRRYHDFAFVQASDSTHGDNSAEIALHFEFGSIIIETFRNHNPPFGEAKIKIFHRRAYPSQTKEVHVKIDCTGIKLDSVNADAESP
jgi:hypothetical protein